MEHATITRIDEDMFKVVPDEGYRLKTRKLPFKYYSDAVSMKPEKEFKAVKI